MGSQGVVDGRCNRGLLRFWGWLDVVRVRRISKSKRPPSIPEDERYTVELSLEPGIYLSDKVLWLRSIQNLWTPPEKSTCLLVAVQRCGT